MLLAGPRERRFIALTFDDGPDPQTTPQVLAELAQHGACATFFVIGEASPGHPHAPAGDGRAGHQIENHSLHHSWATAFLTRARLVRELSQAQALIARTTGKTRPGSVRRSASCRRRLLQPASALGLRLCGWSGKSRDRLGLDNYRAGRAPTETRPRPGAILLLHDASEHSFRQRWPRQSCDSSCRCWPERLQAVTLGRAPRRKRATR